MMNKSGKDKDKMSISVYLLCSHVLLVYFKEAQLRSLQACYHICICKVEESGSKAQWAEYLLYLDSMVEDGLLRFIIMFVKCFIKLTFF